jgi:hypothetical protein
VLAVASGRPIEDELLTAAVGLQAGPDGEWDAGELLAALEGALGADVKPFTVQRNLRRFVRNGWIAERSADADGPGRPRKLYRLCPEGVGQAQRAAARLVGAGADWALGPLRTTMVELAPAPGLRLGGPNAGTGVRGPNAGTGLRGPNAGTGVRGPNARA